MDLPTYTNIWRIEKRLYKLYDLRLPMPLPIVWIGVFLGVLVPWSLLLRLLQVPMEMPWHVVYLVPPGIVTWLSTRPVIESKRLNELLQSQLRYFGEPKTWCRLAPADEPDEVVFTAKVWRSGPQAARVASAEAAQAASKARRGARAKPKHTAPRKRAMPSWAPARQMPSVKQASRPGAVVPGEVRPAVAAAAAAVTTLPAAETSARLAGRQRVTWTSAAAQPAAGLPAIAPPPSGPARPAAGSAPPVTGGSTSITGVSPHVADVSPHVTGGAIPVTGGGTPVIGGVTRASGSATPASGPAAFASGIPDSATPAPGAVTPAPGAAPASGAAASAGGPVQRRISTPDRVVLRRDPSPDRLVAPRKPSHDRLTTEQGLSTERAAEQRSLSPERSAEPRGLSRDPAAEPPASERSRTGLAATPPPIGTEALRRLRRLAASAESRSAAAGTAPAGGAVPAAGTAPETKTAPETRTASAGGTVPASGALPADGQANERRAAEAEPVASEPAPSAHEPERSAAAPARSAAAPEPSAAGAGPSVPETGRPVPETERSVPETGRSVPEAERSVPEAERSVPEAERSVPEPRVGPGALETVTGVRAGAEESDVREQHRKGQPPRAATSQSRLPEARTVWPVSRTKPAETSISRTRPPEPSPSRAEPSEVPVVRAEASEARTSRTVSSEGAGGAGRDVPRPDVARPAVPRAPVRPAAREQGAPPLSIRAVPTGPGGATADPAAPSVPVPVPRPGDEPRVRRVESVVGRDQSGGWRRLAQVVVGGGGPNRNDGIEMDEARARTVLAGSRRIVVLGCTGGAGQTTTTLMLGHTLARYREDRVLAVDANTGDHTLTGRIATDSPETLTSLLAGLDGVSGYLSMRAYTTRCESGLEVVGSDSDAAAGRRLADRGLFSDERLAHAMRALDRHYRLILVDPAASMAARMLSYADQLVLVAPASEDAPDAVAMTFDWLDGHGSTELRRRAVMVINGVSRRSMAGVEQAEAVARGRCRAIVRVPWEDELAPGRAEPVQLAHLRAGGRRAYVALAGVVASGLAVASRPSEEEVAQ
ncbi:TcpE family conjugal transfer membrane protein [Sphaerisporangium dianthi]|uniref:TcpE family conjugal transfer membrane protein n=1 Tax=Sphaerisporangium dianthi TaxID=1436120 RepID=A0ABV9CIR3_9ACTN